MHKNISVENPSTRIAPMTSADPEHPTDGLAIGTSEERRWSSTGDRLPPRGDATGLCRIFALWCRPVKAKFAPPAVWRASAAQVRRRRSESGTSAPAQANSRAEVEAGSCLLQPVWVWVAGRFDRP